MNETLASMLPANRSLDPSTCIPPTISSSSSGGSIAVPTSAPNHQDTLPMTDSGSSQTAESSTWVHPSASNIVSVFENSERALHASNLLSATLSASGGVIPPSTSLPMDNSLSASLASSALLSLAASSTSSASYHSHCFLATASHPIAAAPVAAPSLSSSSSSPTPSATTEDAHTPSKSTSTLATGLAAPGSSGTSAFVQGPDAHSSVHTSAGRTHRYEGTLHPPAVSASSAALARAPHLYPRMYTSYPPTHATAGSAFVGSPDPTLHDATDAASALPSPPHVPSSHATVIGTSPAAARALSNPTTLPRSGIIRARPLEDEHAHAEANVHAAAGTAAQDSGLLAAPPPKRARLQGQSAGSPAAAPAMLSRLSFAVAADTDPHNTEDSNTAAYPHTHEQQATWAMLNHPTKACAHAPYAAARAQQRSPGSDDEDSAASFFVPVPGSHPPAETMPGDSGDAASVLFCTRVWPRDAAAMPTHTHDTHAPGLGAAAPALIMAVHAPTPNATTAPAPEHTQLALERAAQPPSLRVDVTGLDAPSRRAATLSACAADPPRALLSSLPRAETAAPTLTVADSPRPSSSSLSTSPRSRRSRSLSAALLPLPPQTHTHVTDPGALSVSASGELPTVMHDAYANAQTQPHAEAHAEVQVQVAAATAASVPTEDVEGPSSLLRVFGKRSEAARAASLAAGTPAPMPALTPNGADSPLHAAAQKRPAGAALDFAHVEAASLPLSLSQPGASFATGTAVDSLGHGRTPAGAAPTNGSANATTSASVAYSAADLPVDMGAVPALEVADDLPLAVPVEVPVHTTHTTASPSASLSAPPRAYTALNALSSDASFAYPALPALHPRMPFVRPRGDIPSPQFASAAQAAFTAAQAAAQALSPREAAEMHYAAYAAYAALAAVSDLPAAPIPKVHASTTTSTQASAPTSTLAAAPGSVLPPGAGATAILTATTIPSVVHGISIHIPAAAALPTTSTAPAVLPTTAAPALPTTVPTTVPTAVPTLPTMPAISVAPAGPMPTPAAPGAATVAHAHAHATATHITATDAAAAPNVPPRPSLTTLIAAFTAPASVPGNAATQPATHNLTADDARAPLTTPPSSSATSPALTATPYAHTTPYIAAPSAAAMPAQTAFSHMQTSTHVQTLTPTQTHTQTVAVPPVLASPVAPSAELSPDAARAADALRAALGVPFAHLPPSGSPLSSATAFPYVDPAHPHASAPQRPPAALHDHVPLTRLPQMYMSLAAQPAHAWMGPAFQRLWLLTASCELTAATADALTSPVYHCLTTPNLRAVVARAGHSGFVCDPMGWLSRFLQRRLWGFAYNPIAAARVPALASVAHIITSQPLQCMTVAPPHQVTSIMQPTRAHPRTPALPIPYAGELTFVCLPPGLVFTCPRSASAVAPHIELAAHSRSRSRASAATPGATSARRGRAVRPSARAGPPSVDDEDELAAEDSPVLTFATPAASAGADDEAEVDTPRTTAATWATPLQTPLLGTHTIAAARSLLRQATTAHQTTACAGMLPLLAPASVAHAQARASEAVSSLSASATHADTTSMSPNLAPGNGSPAMGEGAGVAPSSGEVPREHRVIAWHQAMRHLIVCGQLTDTRLMAALTAVVPQHSTPDVAFARLLRPWLQCVPTCVGETLESDVFGLGDDGGQTSRRAIIHTGQVELRQWFMEAPKPSKALVCLIANTLMLPTKTVYRWFRNERYASARRDKGEEEDSERQDGDDLSAATPAIPAAGSKPTKARGRRDAAAAVAEPARDEEETEAQQQAVETQLHTRQAERRDAVTFDTHIRTQLLYLLQLCEVYHPALLELMPLLGAVEADHVRRSLASLVPDELLDTLRPNGRTTGALQPFVDYTSPLLRSLAEHGYDTAALNAGVSTHACVNKYEWTSAQEKAALTAPKQQRRSKKRKNAQQVNAEVRRAVNETCVMRLTIIRKVMEQVHAARTLCPSLPHYLQALCAVAVHTSGDSEALREVSRSEACEWEPTHVLSLANSIAAMRAGASVALASTISLAAQSSATQVMATLASADAWPQAAFSQLIAAGVLAPSAIPPDSTMLPPPLPHAHAGIGAHANACGSGNHCSGTCSLVPILLMHAVQQVVPAAAPRVREIARVQQQLYLFEACATADLWAEHIAGCPAPRACGVSLDAVGALWEELDGVMERVGGMDATAIAAELAAEGGQHAGGPDAVSASIDMTAAAVAAYTASQAPPVPSSWTAREYRPLRPAAELARSLPLHRPEVTRTSASQRGTATRGGTSQRGSGPRTRGGGRQHAAVHAHAEDIMEDADELPHGSSLPAPPTLPALPPLPTLASLPTAATPAPTCFPNALSEAGAAASAQLRGLRTVGTVTQPASAQPSLLASAIAAALATANAAIPPPPSMLGPGQTVAPTHTPMPTQSLLHGQGLAHAATDSAGVPLRLGEVAGSQVGPDSLIATAAARLATYASTSPAASPVPAFTPPQQQPAAPAPYSYLGPAALSAASSHTAPAHTAAPTTAAATATAPASASALTPLLGAKQPLQTLTHAHTLLPASARAAPPALLPSTLPASSAQHVQQSLPLIAASTSAPALLPASTPTLPNMSVSTAIPANTPTPAPTAVCVTAPTPAPVSAPASMVASTTASTTASADALYPPDSLLAPCSLPSLASLTSLAHEHAAYMYSQAAPHSTPARPTDTARANSRADVPLTSTPLASRQSSVRVPPPFTPTPAPPASLSFAAVTAPLHMALPSTTSYNTAFTVPRPAHSLPPAGTLPDADGDVGPRSWVAAAAGDALTGLMGMAAMPPSQHRWLTSSASSAGMGTLTTLAAAPSCGSPATTLSHTNMFGSPSSRLPPFPAHTPAGIPTPSPAQPGAVPRLRSTISTHSLSRGLVSPPSALPQFLPGGTPTTAPPRPPASHGILSPALLSSNASAAASVSASASSSLPLRTTLTLRTRGYGAPPLQPPPLIHLGSGSTAATSTGTSAHTMDAAFFLAATPIPASASTRDADGTAQQPLQPQSLSRRTSPADAQEAQAQAQAGRTFAVPRPRFPYTPNAHK